MAGGRDRRHRRRLRRELAGGRPAGVPALRAKRKGRAGTADLRSADLRPRGGCGGLPSGPWTTADAAGGSGGLRRRGGRHDGRHDAPDVRRVPRRPDLAVPVDLRRESDRTPARRRRRGLAPRRRRQTGGLPDAAAHGGGVRPGPDAHPPRPTIPAGHERDARPVAGHRRRRADRVETLPALMPLPRRRRHT